MTPYPGWLPSRYNASTDPCDMLEGPCACGAWHKGMSDAELEAAWVAKFNKGCDAETAQKIDDLLARVEEIRAKNASGVV